MAANMYYRVPACAHSPRDVHQVLEVPRPCPLHQDPLVDVRERGAAEVQGVMAVEHVAVLLGHVAHLAEHLVRQVHDLPQRRQAWRRQPPQRSWISRESFSPLTSRRQQQNTTFTERA